jgi:PhnB protein
METRRNNRFAPGIKVKDMQCSLEFYTKILGFIILDKLICTDGKIAHALVGIVSPALSLSPIDSVCTPQAKKELAENKLGVGVRFHFGMTGARTLDEYFTELKSKGIKIVNEPKNEFWGGRIFTVEDPDGYTLSFSEHVQDVSPEARVHAYERTHRKGIRSSKKKGHQPAENQENKSL